MTGVFLPWLLANATNRNSPQLVVDYLLALPPGLCIMQMSLSAFHSQGGGVTERTFRSDIGERKEEGQNDS